MSLEAHVPHQSNPTCKPAGRRKVPNRLAHGDDDGSFPSLQGSEGCSVNSTPFPSVHPKDLVGGFRKFRAQKRGLFTEVTDHSNFSRSGNGLVLSAAFGCGSSWSGSRGHRHLQEGGRSLLESRCVSVSSSPSPSSIFTSGHDLVLIVGTRNM